MGKQNRQRRQEKQRRRDKRRADRPQAPHGLGGVRYRVDELPTVQVIRMAAAALAEEDPIAGEFLADLAARPDARRQVEQAVGERVTELAQVGWDEPLLANMVRRRLSKGHTRVLAGSTADEPVGVVASVELLAMMLTLPPLPALPSASVVDEAQAKVLAKVRGLLAKAESTTFPDEADALSAKAQELMTRHAIDHALAAAAARPESPGGRRLPIEDPYADAKAFLVTAVCQANACRSVHVTNMGHVALLGFEADLVAVELLFTSLLVQASRAMLAAGRSDRGARQRGFRSSFLSAYAQRIGQRLKDATAGQIAEADAEADGLLLPVLAARTDAVDDAVDAVFGDRLTQRETRISDYRGWVAGHSAADLADLAVGRGLRATG